MLHIRVTKTLRKQSWLWQQKSLQTGSHHLVWLIVRVKMFPLWLRLCICERCESLSLWLNQVIKQRCEISIVLSWLKGKDVHPGRGWPIHCDALWVVQSPSHLCAPHEMGAGRNPPELHTSRVSLQTGMEDANGHAHRLPSHHSMWPIFHEICPTMSWLSMCVKGVRSLACD